MKFPKTLYVIEQGTDQATHMGHKDVNEIVVDTNEPTVVAVYRLVEKREYICASIAKRTNKKASE